MYQLNKASIMPDNYNIEVGIPLPSAGGGRCKELQDVFRRMVPGQSIQIPASLQATARAAQAEVWKKNRKRVTILRIVSGTANVRWSKRKHLREGVDSYYRAWCIR